PLRRLGGRMGWWSEPARRVYLEKIPFVLLGGGASAIAFIALFQIHNTESLADLTVLGRLAISAYGLCFYLWKMILPLTLSPLYELGTVNPRATPFLLSYGGVVALTALAVACHRRVPGLSAAGLAYVAILLPVLGIFHNGPQIAADRYTYLAGLGWAVLAGASLLSGWRRRPFLSTGLAACVLVGLGVLTWNQVQVWRDSERLWTQALTVDPKSSIAHYNWGVVLAQQGKLADAGSHYQRALEIRSDPDGPLVVRDRAGQLALLSEDHAPVVVGDRRLWVNGQRLGPKSLRVTPDLDLVPGENSQPDENAGGKPGRQERSPSPPGEQAGTRQYRQS